MEVTFSLSRSTVCVPDAVLPWAESFASGMMDVGELLMLAGTIASYPWDDTDILVEIGAYLGQTTVFMAKVLEILGKRVPILSIDPFERVQPDPLNPQGIYPMYLSNIRTHHVDDICLPLVAFSEHAAPVVPDCIGVLVVDGGHHYPVVARDLELYGRKVRPGGLVFVDDYGPCYPGVIRAVDEYFTPDQPFALLHRSYFTVAQRRC